MDNAGNISNRAWEATLQGRYQEALHIYDVELAEELARYNHAGPLTHLGNQAVLFILMGDLDKALEMSRQIRYLQHPTAYPVPLIGAILWMQGKHTEACDDWAFEIERRRSGVITHCDEAGGVEVPALLWWASAHTGFQGWRKLAEQELKRRGRTKRCQCSRWPGPLVPYLLSQSLAEPESETRLFDAIGTTKYDNLNFRRHSLTHFYIGAAKLNKSDVPQYKHHLEQVTGMLPPELLELRLSDSEYHLARAELQGAKE